MILTPGLNPIQGSFVGETEEFWTINWQQFTELLTFVDFAANEKLTIGFVRINFEKDLDILMEGLKTHRRCQDIQFEVFNLDDKNLWSVREELMKGLKVIERDREKKLVLIVRGLASSIGLSGEYPLVLQTLNLNRDAFEITVPHPIIFCLPDYAIDRLSRYAPDFWVWRSGVFDFEATQKTQDTALASSLLSDGFLERPERQEKLERIEFLHSRLVKYTRSNSNKTNGDLNSRISLLNELGVAYRSQGKFNDAGEYLSGALKLANTQEEPRNRDLALKARVLRNLGTIDVANKDFDSALAYYQQALEIEEEIGNFLGKADTLERMTNLYTSKLGLNGTLAASEYQEAERLLVDVWRLKKRLLGDSHPDLAISRNNLALLYQYQGRYADAEPLYLEALALRKELLGSLGPDFVKITNNLARLYYSQGRYEEAEPLYLEALAERKELLGEKHPDVALSMNNLATLYESRGRYGEAEPLLIKALALRKELLGPSHPQVAANTNNLAAVYYSQGRYEEAEPLYLEALALAKELLGPSHPHLATITNNLAMVYQSQGRYGEAEPLYLEALALAKKFLGSSHSQVATSTNNLAAVYYSQGRYEEAEPLYLEALALTKELLGPSHPQVATSTNNLALLYQSQGRYEKAEPLYLEALALTKQLLGEEHPQVATSTNNLAALYESQGRYEEAEALYLEALTLTKKFLGEEHPQVATSTNNLAGLYQSQGRYEEAEALYLEALALTKKLLGPSHPDVAASTNNLAELYRSQGRYSEAEPLYLEALALRKELQERSHPDVVTITNNLAELYRSQGRYTEMEPLYLEALALTKKLLGDSHPDVALSMNNLAFLYKSQERYEKAEPLYLEALALRKELLGDSHPDVALSMNNLAGLYYSQGRYTEAEPLYLEALALRKELLGDSHPQVAASRNNLAVLLALTDRPTEALALMKEATEVEDRLIRRTFATSSDRDGLAYMEKIRPNFERLLSLVRNHLWDSPAAVATALDVVLKRKSLTASALAAFNHALNSDRYPHLTEDFQRWQQLNQEIVELTFSPPEANWPTTREQFRQQKQDRQQRLNQLQAESDELQRRLASQISEIQVPEQDSHIRAIASELPAGSALLEFVGYRNYDFANNSWQPSRYLAFVLPAGQPEGVRAVDLGDGEEIDRSIARFRQATKEPTSTSELELGQGIFSEELQEAIEGYRHLLSFWGAWLCQRDTRSLEL